MGRVHELSKIRELLNDKSVRLLTILAPGGMGKTRLAIEVAHGQVDRFADGLYFVPLAPITSSDDMITAIGDTMGFMFHGEQSPSKQLLAYLQDRSLLLILDNFEHLLDSASWITEMLQVSPDVTVIVTSRERLNLHGETIYTLFGLHYPTWDSPDDIFTYDAVNLFMQCARRIQVDFEVEPVNLSQLRHICKLTAGMPLAIELAVGWIDILSLEQIAGEIQQGLDILETELRDLPVRHRSIRATFDRTWHRLTHDEQTIFAKLSVFRGGFTLSAAQAIAGAEVRHVRRFTQKALVQSEIEDRLSIHELLRQYAAEKLLNGGDSDDAEQAHSVYYLNFLAERDHDIKGRRQQAGLQEIQIDFENIRKGWLWAIQHNQYSSINPALDALVNFGEMSFSLTNTRTLIQQTIPALQSLADKNGQLTLDRVIIRCERVNYLLGEAIDADKLRDILIGLRTRDTHHEIAYCLEILGTHYHWRAGDYDAAMACYDECLALWRRQGDDFYVAQVLRNVHHVYRIQNQVDHSLESLRELVSIRREIGDDINLCASLCVIGWVLCFYGEFQEADALQDEALRIQERIGRVPYYGYILGVKATINFWRGDISAAEHQLQTAQGFSDGRDYLGLQLYLRIRSGWLASIMGDYHRGHDLCNINELELLPNVETAAMWGLALAQCGRGYLGAAWQSLHQTLRTAIHYTRGTTYQQLCCPIAAVLCAQAGEFARAGELIGITQAAPKELMGWLEQWQLFQSTSKRLEEEFDTETYVGLVERGAHRDLDEVVDELLAGIDGNATY